MSLIIVILFEINNKNTRRTIARSSNYRVIKINRRHVLRASSSVNKLTKKSVHERGIFQSARRAYFANPFLSSLANYHPEQGARYAAPRRESRATLGFPPNHNSNILSSTRREQDAPWKKEEKKNPPTPSVSPPPPSSFFFRYHSSPSPLDRSLYTIPRNRHLSILNFNYSTDYK